MAVTDCMPEGSHMTSAQSGVLCNYLDAKGSAFRKVNLTRLVGWCLQVMEAPG